MTQSDLESVRKAFQIYKDTVSKTENDLVFFRSFLKHTIDVYLAQEYKPDQIYSAVFHAYSIYPDAESGLSKMFKEANHLNTSDLHSSSESFFSSIAIKSLLSIYNAMEIFIFEAIKIRHFTELQHPTGSRQATNELAKAIEEDLKSQGKKVDKRNNKHVLAFLREKSPAVNWFLEEKIRIDLTTDWKNFFELISILRNLTGHHGTVVSVETKHEIDSKAKDVFERHFQLIVDQNGFLNLMPVIDQFSNFICFYNDFTMNLVKFTFEHYDFDMFDMY